MLLIFILVKNKNSYNKTMSSLIIPAAMFGIPVVNDCIKAYKGAAKMRVAATKAKEDSAKALASWNLVSQKNAVIDQQMMSEFPVLIDSTTQQIALLKQNAIDFKKRYKSIQLAGVIIICVVFFLLMMKQFGLFEQLGIIISWPFRTLFGKA